MEITNLSFYIDIYHLKRHFKRAHIKKNCYQISVIQEETKGQLSDYLRESLVLPHMALSHILHRIGPVYRNVTDSKDGH